MVIDRSNINIMLILKSNSKNSGFTIVELLVVIVVIGILAAITIVSYSGITKKAATAVLQSDTSSASKQLEIFKITNGAYPSTTNCLLADSNTNLCLKTSSSTAFTYQVPDSNSPKSYTLYAANSSSSQIVMKSNQSTINTVSKICPINFVLVPGSPTYGTSDFCAMKYEARVQGVDSGYAYGGTNISESRPTGGQWTGISQPDAITAAATACAGCHLMTAAEWMTIAQNVASVASNWSNGQVGSGYIYSGYSGAEWVPASSDDDDGYYKTSYYTYPDSRTVWDYQQKRTLTLTNGQVIWDFAGGVAEWDSHTGVGGYSYSDAEWTNVSVDTINNLTSKLGVNPSPAGTGINGAGTWTNSNNKIGVVTLYTDGRTDALVRGISGIFGVRSYYTISTSSIVGFRSAQ